MAVEGAVVSFIQPYIFCDKKHECVDALGLNCLVQGMHNLRAFTKYKKGKWQFMRDGNIGSFNCGRVLKNSSS
jgi:hypothetical protein